MTDAHRPATSTLSRSVSVTASPERVWELVSDLPGMGAFSPENRGGTWTRGATGPALGAAFVGRNGSGGRSWSTRSTVTRCEPGRSFAFAVRSVGLPVAEWTYEIEPTEQGCRLTEQWQDRRGRVMRVLGPVVTGVQDRESFTTASIEQTLAAVKERAEQPG